MSAPYRRDVSLALAMMLSGVDPVQTKVDLINNGQSPIIEADIGEYYCFDCSKRPITRHRRRSPSHTKRRSYLLSASARQVSPMETSISGTSGAFANKSARR